MLVCEALTVRETSAVKKQTFKLSYFHIVVEHYTVCQEINTLCTASQLNNIIMSIKGGLYFVVVLMGLTVTKLG